MDSPQKFGLEYFEEDEVLNKSQQGRRAKRTCSCEGSACLVGGGRARTRRRLRALRRAMGEGDAAQFSALLLTGCWPDPLLQCVLKAVSREDMARAFAASAPGFFYERGGGARELLCAAREGRAGAVRALLAAGDGQAAAETKLSLARALPVACQRGHADCVEVLLEYGADPRQILEEDNTPLHLAAMAGSVASVRALLEYGADADAEDDYSRTPLYKAVYYSGDALCVRTLLEAGADPNHENWDGFTPLHAACSVFNSLALEWLSTPKGLNMEQCVRELVKGGADVNKLWLGVDSPLLGAIEADDVGVVRILLDSGANIHHRTRRGETVVHIAALSRKTVRCLVELLNHPECPSIETRDKNGDTALLVAVNEGKSEAVKALLRAGADHSARDAEGRTVLHNAAYHCFDEAVEELLSAGADVNAVVEDEGLTVLHLAVQNYKDSVVAMLLEKGADINARTVNGKTPLHFATCHWDLDCIGKILDRGANLEDRDDAGFSVLHYVAKVGNDKMVEMLIRRGLSLEDRAADGQTALHVAAAVMQARCVAAMLQRLRAPVNARDHVGRTALHVAARTSDEDTVRELLLGGAHRTARDDFGDSPADVTENGDIKRLIRRWALAA